MSHYVYYTLRNTAAYSLVAVWRLNALYSGIWLSIGRKNCMGKKAFSRKKMTALFS